jgi:hypothetical protein
MKMDGPKDMEIAELVFWCKQKALRNVSGKLPIN